MATSWPNIDTPPQSYRSSRDAVTPEPKQLVEGDGDKHAKISPVTRKTKLTSIIGLWKRFRGQLLMGSGIGRVERQPSKSNSSFRVSRMLSLCIWPSHKGANSVEKRAIVLNGRGQKIGDRVDGVWKGVPSGLATLVHDAV